jgi:hypothetical protein
MKRRDFVRTLISASLAPKLLVGQQADRTPTPAAGPIPWTRGLNPETPLPSTAAAVDVAQSDFVFFSPLQMNTLQRLSDLLMPAIGIRPGALEAKTPEFLDFLIGTSSEERKKEYSLGLDWLEASAQSKFKKPFAKLDADQADALIKPWLQTWMTDHPPTESHAGFLSTAHDDIRSATINSKEWKAAHTANPDETTQESLYWSPIEPDILYGENATRGGTAAPASVAAKAAKGMPVYRR